MSLQKKNISHKSILNKSDPSIDPSGTATTTSNHDPKLMIYFNPLLALS